MNQKSHVPPKSTICPSCQRDTTFRYVREQEYPLSVAQAAGFNTNRFSLWMCDSCQTSQLVPIEESVKVIK